jgi:integrase/recombinase XerD
MSPNALVQLFARLFAAANLAGCSSHSGRRTAITSWARSLSEHQCSIIDLQRLSGHRHLVSVIPYLEASRGVVDLVTSA